MTNETIKNFHKDAHALGNLKPDFEPKATDHISEMIEMIEKLISNGFAYVSSEIFCLLLKNIKLWCFVRQVTF